jgi:hypothetical protein
MSEFVSTADEQKAQQESDRKATLRQFVSQWQTEDIPACDEGVSLLLDFAEAHPSSYRLALVRGLDGDPHPMVRNLAKWKAYAQHVSTCPEDYVWSICSAF